VFLDGVEKIRGAAIVEQENTLTESPEGRGAELVGSSAALRDTVSKVCTHVMNKQVGVQIGVDLA